jgi:hypothetical protein
VNKAEKDRTKAIEYDKLADDAPDLEIKRMLREAAKQRRTMAEQTSRKQLR